MTCPGFIKILAEGFDFGDIIPLVIVGILWAIGAIVSQMKKKEAEAKTNRIHQQKAIKNNDKEDNEGWEVVAPPPQQNKSAWQERNKPPVQQPKPVPTQKPSIRQFVKNKPEDSHAMLIQPKAIEHLQHVQVEPLPVLHAEGDLSSRHLYADDDQEQPVGKLISKPIGKFISKPIDKFIPKPIGELKTLQPQIPTPPEVTVGTIKSMIGKARLANPQTARLAMIFHEIFSPPKALRDEVDMWD